MLDLIYSKENCPPCEIVKNFIEEKNLQDKVQLLTFQKDFTLEEFYELGFKSTPSMITKDQIKIIGSMNIIDYLKLAYGNN